ncbi:MAG: PIN domain-containing protein [Actinomycetota bacterium]|nr:PIN domain-containing protein [Actinomycetota bacterium]
MILPDVNVLVFAFRRESVRHREYAGWLTGVVGGGEELALHEAPLAGFVRIVTNARIFAQPAPAEVALDFVARLVAAGRSRWLVAPGPTWARFDALLRDDAGVTANLVPDALLASLALTHGCRLATADRGFARYPGLAWFDPVAA